jgi:microcystin degradation protein MlrC
MRILIGECKQEVSSFNPAPSHLDDFIIITGQEILALHRGAVSEIRGALSVFDERSDVELVPTYSARAITSAGTLAAGDFRRLAADFLDSIREKTPPVDAVYLSLHGAMSAEGEGDPEGYLLQEVRRILGERIPIVISLDLHGILTDRMLQRVDGLTVYHTYPHVDFFDTGGRAARLLLKIVDGEAHPVIAKVEIPALARGDENITETGLFGDIIRECQAIERRPSGLAAGMFIGNPFTDVPDLRSNSFVITNGDPASRFQAEEMACGEAVRLARRFWDVHERLQAPLTPLREAVEQAKHAPDGTTVLVDAADATSSGASGDSNAILRALIDAGYQRRSLIPIVDASAVAAAMRAGIGATVRVSLGGSVDPRFEPVEVEVRVRMLSDGVFSNESHGGETRAGNSAVLVTTDTRGSHTIVATSHAVSLYDRSLFLAHALDPKSFDLVVVKSPHCQPRFFKDWAALYVNVDAPGSTSANLRSLGHTVCRRPIFPLDEDVPFEPAARVFRR